MGGRPLYDWTGVDLMWGTKSKSPNQLHPTNSSGAQKSYNYHQKGLKTTFDHGSDLSVFQTALLKKLQDTSMDTITYLYKQGRMGEYEAFPDHRQCGSKNDVSFLQDSCDVGTFVWK
jgi:hypothetical protein